MIPAARFVVFKPEVAHGAQGPVIVDHLFVVGQPLVYVQRAGVPLFGRPVLTLVVPHLPDGETGIGNRFLVLTALDDFEPLFQPFGRGVILATARRNQSVLVEHGGGARINLAVGLLQQIRQQLLVETGCPVQLQQFHRFHRVRPQQILPELDGFVGFSFRCSVPDGFQQLAPQPTQLREPLLHPVNLRQRLNQQLCVVPLSVFQRQTQRLGQVALFRQHRCNARILILVKTFHEIVGGVGVNAHKLRLQPPDPVAGQLPTQLAPQEPRHRRIDLKHAGGNGLHEPGGHGSAQQRPAPRI